MFTFTNLTSLLKAQRGKWKVDERCALVVKDTSVYWGTFSEEELSSTQLDNTLKFTVRTCLKLFSPETRDFVVCTLSTDRGFGKIFWACMCVCLCLSVYPSLPFSSRNLLHPGHLIDASRFLYSVSVNGMQKAYKANSQTAAFFSHSQKSSGFAADVFLSFFVSPLSAYAAEHHSHWFSMNRELEEREKEGKGKERKKEITEGKSVIVCNSQQCHFQCGLGDTCVWAITFFVKIFWCCLN